MSIDNPFTLDGHTMLTICNSLPYLYINMHEIYFFFSKRKEESTIFLKVYKDIQDFKDHKSINIRVHDTENSEVLDSCKITTVLTFNFVCKSSLLVMMLVTSVSFNP